MLQKKRFEKDDSAVIAALMVLVLAVIIFVASVLILVFLGAAVFGVSLLLGAIFVFGLLMLWFGPGILKLVGLVLIAVSIIIAIVSILL